MKFLLLLLGFLKAIDQKYFFKSDLDKLGLEIIEFPQFEKNIDELVKYHDITLDKEFVLNKEFYKQLIQAFTADVEMGFEQYENTLFVNKISKNKSVLGEEYGYGLFTNKAIGSDVVIGFHTGVYTDSKTEPSTSQRYISQFEDMNDLYMNQETKSNILKFAKKDVSGNCDQLYFPYKERWVILVVTNQEILELQEIILQPFDHDLVKQDIQQDMKLEQFSRDKYQDLAQSQPVNNLNIHLSNTEYLNETIVDQEIAESLNSHDLYSDWKYQNYITHYQNENETYANIQESIVNMDDYIVAKFVDEDSGYSLFAKQDIAQNTILGEYTGVIREFVNQMRFYKAYPSEVQNKSLVIDSLKSGNILKFMNSLESHNTEQIVVPYKNRWHVFYKTTVDIKEGEQLSSRVSEQYWQIKEKLDFNNNKMDWADEEEDNEELTPEQEREWEQKIMDMEKQFGGMDNIKITPDLMQKMESFQDYDKIGVDKEKLKEQIQETIQIKEKEQIKISEL